MTSQLNSKIYEFATNKRLHDSTVDLDVKLLKMQLSDANVEIAKQRATIRDLEIKINESDAYLSKAVNFETELSLANTENKLIKSKMEWLKAAIADVKDSYSDCKKMLAVGEVANESLRRSLNCAKSKCMGMVVESRDREYKLAESQMMIAELKKALSLSRSECVITKTCTASSNTLLLQQQSEITELLAERELLLG